MTLQRRDFDTLWLAQQVAACRHRVTIIERELDSGRNVQVKVYAGTYLGDSRRHLHMADSLYQLLR